MKNIFSNQKGLTLLELIVVMAITVVVGVLGIYGLVLFKRTSTLTQASREFVSNLESARNKARNNTLSTVKRGQAIDPLVGKVDAYAISIDTATSDYSLKYCMLGTTVTTDYDCSGAERDNLKAKIYSDVLITFEQTSPYTCRGILFEAVTGRIMIFNDFAAIKPSTSTYCDVSLSFGPGTEKRTIRIDAANQRIFYI